jgi:methyl-accepting chemotaxis protein
MRIRDLTIGRRLAAGYAALFCIIALLCVISFRTVVQTDRRVDEITKVTFQKAILANSVLANLLTINKDQAKAVYTRDKAPLQGTAEKRKAYMADLEKLEKMETRKEGKDLIAKYRESAAQARELNAKMNKAIEQDSWDEALSVMKMKADPPPYMAIVDQLVKFEESGVQEEYRAIAEANRGLKVTLVIFGAIGLALCGIISVVTTKSITSPIKENIEVAKTLAQGNLSVQVTVDRKDEFGDNAAALKSMVEKWRDVVAGIKQASDNVASASVELSTSAEQMQKGSAQQAERSHQVATASEEMSQTVLDISRNASGIASTATAAAATAKDGGKIVNEAVKEVRQIAETVEESEGHITSLEELSKRIGEIIGIINEIADQTNLLALNAAIEAARAGEHGRGFAVVADEVRKLAERTTGATSEVGGIIKEIQGKVGSAVSSIERVSSKVERGVELSTKAGVELSNIVRSVDELHNMVQQIATAIEEMSATSDQISQDIESISGISNDTSVASGEVTKASQELARLGTDLQNISKRFDL